MKLFGGHLARIEALLDGVSFLLCSEGDGDGGGDGNDGAAAAAAAGLGTGDSGASANIGMGGENTGGESTSDPGAEGPSEDTGPSIGVSALATQADAQAAMASLGYSSNFGTVGPSFGIDAGTLGLGYGNITGIGPTANLGVEGTNLGFSSPQAAINDEFGTIDAVTAQNEQAARDAVLGVAMPGLSHSTPAAPFGTIATPPAPSPATGVQGSLTGPTNAQVSQTVADLGVSLSPQTQTPTQTTQVAEMDPVTAFQLAVQAPPPTQTTSLPTITVDAPTAHAPVGVPGQPGTSNVSNPGISPGPSNTGVPNSAGTVGPSAADAAAAAAAMGVTGAANIGNAAGIAAGGGGAAGPSIASFAVPPQGYAPSADASQAIIADQNSQAQAEIAAYNTQQQQQQAIQMQQQLDREAAIAKAKAEIARQALHQQQLQNPQPNVTHSHAPPASFATLAHEHNAFAPSPEEQAKDLTKAIDEALGTTPNVAGKGSIPGSVADAVPYGLSPTPPSLADEVGKALSTIASPPPADFNSRFSFPTVAPPPTVDPTTVTRPAPIPEETLPMPEPLSPQIAVPIPMARPAPPPVARPAPPPVARPAPPPVARPAPPPTARQNKALQEMQPKVDAILSGRANRGTLGTGITGFTPGSNLGRSPQQNQVALPPEGVSRTAAEAMQALYGIPITR